MVRPIVSLAAWLIVTVTVLAADAKTSGPWPVEKILDTPTPFKVDSHNGDLQAIRYQSEAFHGKPTQVFAYYAVPQGKGPFPAMLLVHGGGGKAFAEWAQLWVDRGYVALAMDLAGNGADGKRLANGGPPQDDESKFNLTADNPLEDMWTYQAVAAVLRGHALLAQQPQVDKSRIGITGISWGGYLTCIVAGIDHRLTVAVPVYGCGFLGDNSAWRDAGRFDRMPSEVRDRWLKHFDPSQYLAGVECPTLFVNGTNDFAYPLDSYQKSYQLVTAPRTLCITVNMPHGHQAGWAPPEIGAFVDSVLKGGPPLVTLGPAEVQGNRLTTTFSPQESLSKAQLHYTTDSGPWQKRTWSSVDANIDPQVHAVSAPIPAERPVVCFFTVRDARGLTVSTQHIALGPN